MKQPDHKGVKMGICFIRYPNQQVTVLGKPDPKTVPIGTELVSEGEVFTNDGKNWVLQTDEDISSTVDIVDSLPKGSDIALGKTLISNAVRLAFNTPKGWSEIPTVTPRTRDRAGIIEAIMAVSAIATAAVIQYEDALYDMQGGNLSGYILNGISHIGVMPVLKNQTDIVDTNWSIVGGTRFTNSSGAVFQAKNQDKATPSTPFAADGLYGVVFSKLGFIDCDVFDIGAINQLGLALGCEVSDIYFTNPPVQGINFENFIQCKFSRLFGTISSNGNGMRFASTVVKEKYIPGNSTFKHIYCHTVKSKSRRIVFEAISGSVLNEISADRIQSNAYGPKRTTLLATFVASSNNITLADATEFEPGMPVVFASTVGNIKQDIAYYILSKAGNVVTIGYRPGGPVTTPTTAGTANVSVQGFPGIEVHGLGDTAAVGSVMHSSFRNLDIESETLVGFSGSEFLQSHVEIVEAFSNQFTNMVLRASGSIETHAPRAIVTDFDDVSAATTGYYGVRDSYRGAAGFGNWVSSDGLVGTTFVRCAGSLDTPDIESKKISGLANFLVFKKPVGSQLAAGTAAMTLSYANNANRTTVFSGTVDTIWNLPAVDGTAPEFEFRIVNASSASLLTINTSGETINGKAGTSKVNIQAGGSAILSTGKTAGGVNIINLLAAYNAVVA